MSDDLLGGLLDGVRKRKTSTGESPPEASGGAGGLNPLDLLAMPPALRDAINWLSRRKQATLPELAAALKRDEVAVTAVVDELKQAGYLKEALIEGQLFYRVVFGGRVTRSGRGVPSDIWNAVDLDNTIFLRQIPLFGHLSQERLADLANHMTAKHYRRNEVIAWQGDTDQDVIFVKNGIVGVTRLLPGSKQDAQILAYLKQGDMVGEITVLLEHGLVADTTATALSEVDVLAMRPAAMREFLHGDRHAALALARLILERLQTTSERLIHTNKNNKLALVFGVGQNSGATTLGAALAMTLSHVTQGKAVYTEHPSVAELKAQFALADAPDMNYHPQRGKFDVAIIPTAVGLPAPVKTTLVMDSLLRDYPSIVIRLPSVIDESVMYMLEKASQLIVVFNPDPASIGELSRLVEDLRGVMHPEKTNLYLVANHTDPDSDTMTVPMRVDFLIPHVDAPFVIGQAQHPADLPARISKVTDLLADRLGRTNQIGIYLPQTETNAVVQETLAFLGGIFGGATATTAEGQAPEDGGEPEILNVVKTYVTKADMDRHLSKVLAFVEQLKTKLEQDALAIEVNAKLMLV